MRDQVQRELLRELPIASERMLKSSLGIWRYIKDDRGVPEEISTEVANSSHALLRLQYGIDNDELRDTIENFRNTCFEINRKPSVRNPNPSSWISASKANELYKQVLEQSGKLLRDL